MNKQFIGKTVEVRDRLYWMDRYNKNGTVRLKSQHDGSFKNVAFKDVEDLLTATGFGFKS